MFYFILAIISALGLLFIYFRRAKSYRLLLMDKALTPDVGILIPHEEEMTAERAEMFSKTIPIHEHLEMKEIFRKGESFFLAGDSDEAEKLFIRVLGLDSMNPTYHSNLALGLYMQRRMEEARDAYLKAIELDPGKANRYINLAQVYRDLGSYDLALEAVEMALQISQNNQYHLIFCNCS